MELHRSKRKICEQLINCRIPNFHIWGSGFSKTLLCCLRYLFPRCISFEHRLTLLIFYRLITLHFEIFGKMVQTVNREVHEFSLGKRTIASPCFLIYTSLPFILNSFLTHYSIFPTFHYSIYRYKESAVRIYIISVNYENPRRFYSSRSMSLTPMVNCFKARLFSRQNFLILFSLFGFLLLKEMSRSPTSYFLASRSRSLNVPNIGKPCNRLPVFNTSDWDSGRLLKIWFKNKCCWPTAIPYVGVSRTTVSGAPP